MEKYSGATGFDNYNRMENEGNDLGAGRPQLGLGLAVLEGKFLFERSGSLGDACNGGLRLVGGELGESGGSPVGGVGHGWGAGAGGSEGGCAGGCGGIGGGGQQEPGGGGRQCGRGDENLPAFGGRPLLGELAQGGGGSGDLHRGRRCGWLERVQAATGIVVDGQKHKDKNNAPDQGKDCEHIPNGVFHRDLCFQYTQVQKDVKTGHPIPNAGRAKTLDFRALLAVAWSSFFFIPNFPEVRSPLRIEPDHPHRHTARLDSRRVGPIASHVFVIPGSAPPFL